MPNSKIDNSEAYISKFIYTLISFHTHMGNNKGHAFSNSNAIQVYNHLLPKSQDTRTENLKAITRSVESVSNQIYYTSSYQQLFQ
jgi:hypothetical protein